MLYKQLMAESDPSRRNRMVKTCLNNWNEDDEIIQSFSLWGQYLQRNEKYREVCEWVETTPKSKSSFRQVRMTSFLFDLLKQYRTHAKELSLKYGIGKLPEWVFFNEDGNFINYDNFLKRQWHKAIEKSELMHRTPHDMRHTYATLRLSKGDSLAEVSKEMGHSTQEITYRTYYKWLPKESYSNIDELDGLQPTATYAQP